MDAIYTYSNHLTCQQTVGNAISLLALPPFCWQCQQPLYDSLPLCHMLRRYITHFLFRYYCLVNIWFTFLFINIEILRRRLVIEVIEGIVLYIDIMARTKTLQTIQDDLFSILIPPYKRQRTTRQSSKRTSKSSQRITRLKDEQNTETENIGRNDLNHGFRDVRTSPEKSRLLNWVSIFFLRWD